MVSYWMRRFRVNNINIKDNFSGNTHDAHEVSMKQNVELMLITGQVNLRSGTLGAGIWH